MSSHRRSPVARFLGAALVAGLLGGASLPASSQTFVPPAPLNSEAATDVARQDLAPRIASDGRDTMVVVWQSQRSGDPTFGSDVDVFFSRSTDGGASWEPQEPLNSDATSDGSRDDERPTLATDGTTWIAVWDATDSPGKDRDIDFAMSSDGAIWTPPAAVDPADTGHDNGVDTTPEIATDGAGHWVAVWVKGGSSIVASLFTTASMTWSPPTPLSPDKPVSPTDSPHVANDGQGWVVVWSATDPVGQDRDIAFSTSSDGLAWSAPAPLNDDAAVDVAQADCEPRVATDHAGSWMAVWSRAARDCDANIDSDVWFATSTQPANGWSAARFVTRSPKALDRFPRLVADGPRTWVVVWEATKLFGPDGDVVLTRSGDDGDTWSEPAPVNTTAENDSAPDLRPDVTRDWRARWVSVWQTTGDQPVPVVLAAVAPAPDSDIWFARATDGLCGNGRVDGAEGCDLGEDNGADGGCCTGWCTAREDGLACTGGFCSAGACVAPPTTCGNGVVEAGEQCDLGSGNGSAGTCCSVTCRYRSAGEACRPAAGACDAEEVCTGSTPDCPADLLEPPGTICRPAAGACDAEEVCAGSTRDCPADLLEPPGTICRPAADACDLGEVCDGAAPSCPPDTRRLEGDTCDDGDPETGTSACVDQVCQGVTTRVAVPPDIVVPPGKSPRRVKIPVTVDIPATPGSDRARVALQGFIDCLDIPPPLPKQCGSALEGVPGAHLARIASVILRVTPPRRRSLGRAQSRSRTVRLPLTRLGRKLFAKLGKQEQSRMLQVQVASSIRDRRGRSIEAVFRTVLERRR